MTRLRTVTHFGVQAQRSILEYVQALRNRYFRATKEEKGKMLDEFTQVTGLHRKTAIRLLNWPVQPEAGNRRGRPRSYSTEAVEALKVVWESSNPRNMHKLWNKDVPNW